MAKRIWYLSALIFAISLLSNINAIAQTVDAEIDGKFNARPFNDFALKYSERVLNQSIDIDAPFTMTVVGKLNENGKLLNAKVTESSGDQKILEMAKDAVSALIDSQILGPFYDIGVRDLKISSIQDKDNFQTIFQFDVVDASVARRNTSALNTMIAMSRMTNKYKDENLLMEKIAVYPENKSVIVKFLISNTEKDALLKKHLSEFQTGK